MTGQQESRCNTCISSIEHALYCIAMYYMYMNVHNGGRGTVGFNLNSNCSSFK